MEFLKEMLYAASSGQTEPALFAVKYLSRITSSSMSNCYCRFLTNKRLSGPEAWLVESFNLKQSVGASYTRKVAGLKCTLRDGIFAVKCCQAVLTRVNAIKRFETQTPQNFKVENR